MKYKYNAWKFEKSNPNFLEQFKFLEVDSNFLTLTIFISFLSVFLFSLSPHQVPWEFRGGCMFGLAIMMHFWETAVGHKNWTTICTTHTQTLNLTKLIMYHTNCKTFGNSVEPWLVYILNIHMIKGFQGTCQSSEVHSWISLFLRK